MRETYFPRNEKKVKWIEVKRAEINMSQEIKINPEEIAKGVELDFSDGKEYWNTYKLSDGTTLKVKIVLTGVKRLRIHRPDGQPIYFIQTANHVRAVDIPKGLMAKPKEPGLKPV